MRERERACACSARETKLGLVVLPLAVCVELFFVDVPLYPSRVSVAFIGPSASAFRRLEWTWFLRVLLD